MPLEGASCCGLYFIITFARASNNACSQKQQKHECLYVIVIVIVESHFQGWQIFLPNNQITYTATYTNW